jgi:hypothetical protein
MSAVGSYKTYGFDSQGIPAVLGLLNGVRQQVILGRNADVDIGSVPEDLIPQGGVYVFQTTAQLVEILSSDADDAAGDTGARTVLVSGLNATYDEVSEVATMNGAGAVALVQTFLRVNRLSVVTAGSSLSNEGTITLRVAGGGATMCVMAPLTGVSHHGIFTVPHGHTLILQSIGPGTISAGGGYITVNIETRSNTVADSPFLSRLTLDIWGFTTNVNQLSNGFTLTEKSDLRLHAVATVADNTGVGMVCSGLLLRTADV